MNFQKNIYTISFFPHIISPFSLFGALLSIVPDLVVSKRVAKGKGIPSTLLQAMAGLEVMAGKIRCFQRRSPLVQIFTVLFSKTIATCVFEVMLNHKQASSALFFSLTRIKVRFLARGLRQKVLESSRGDGFFSRISTREI